MEIAVKLTVKLSLNKIKQHMSPSPCVAETQLAFGFNSEGSTARSNSEQWNMRKGFLEVMVEGIQGSRMRFSISEKHKGWKPKIWKNVLGMTMSMFVRALLSECGDHGGAVAQQ